MHSLLGPPRSADILRFVRALWPVLFLVPLSWWADRGCRYVGVDPLYHTTVWIHERLGWFIVALAAVSVLTVIIKIFIATRRLSHLMDLSEPVPQRVQRSFEIAAAGLSIAVPRVAYLDVGKHIAATVVGPVILLSRGFADELSDDDLTLVARHELVHVSERDAGVGVFWHLAFASLLLPGFEPLERRLHAAREHRANMKAAEGREEAYFSVLARLAHGSSLCAGGGIGLEAARVDPPIISRCGSLRCSSCSLR